MLFNMKYRTLCRLPFVIRVAAVAVVCSVVGSVACAPDLHGQTLFAQPDTTPNYAAYQHIEECWAAALHIEMEDANHRTSIWQDTVERWVRKELNKGKPPEKWWDKRRPEAAIHASQVCLTKFNADTATFLSQFSALQIVKILLIAHRDEDARRFAERALDSMRNDRFAERALDSMRNGNKEYKIMLFSLIGEFGRAKPHRFDDVKQYYARFMAAREPGDSLYWATDAAMALGGYLDEMGDTTAGDRARQLAIRLNDSTPEKERRESPGAATRLLWLASLIATNTQDEGLDSLAKSNVAYELWYKNTVHRRVYGGDSATREEVADALEERKMPQIQGEHYYVTSVSPSPATSSGDATHGVVTYASKGALPNGTLPVKNTINYIFYFPAFCHVETEPRSPDVQARLAFMKGCLPMFAQFRNLKHEFPDIEIVAMSRTYGTVGQLGPLTPAEEADTLAKLLAFRRLPARLVVEETKFYNLPAPDRRRIDIMTPNVEACQERGGCGGFVDKDGYMIPAYREIDETWLRRFYDILKNRPSQ